VRLDDVGNKRPPEIPFRELHFRHIAAVAVLAPIAWLTIIVGSALARHAAIQVGLISSGTPTFVMILALIAVAIKLSWVVIIDWARVRTISLDRKHDHEEREERVETTQATRVQDAQCSSATGVDAKEVDGPGRSRDTHDRMFN
jgi:type VI protein secretion system component VasK